LSCDAPDFTSFNPGYDGGNLGGASEETSMLGIPRRYSHFIFGVIQSGLTSLIAAAIASYSLWGTGRFVQNWIFSWLISWVMMLPAVIFAAPAIQSLALALTRDERRPGS
jgi:hypothetical protein